MPERRHTPVYQAGGNLVRIVILRRSRENPDRYLSTTDPPFAVPLRARAGGTVVVDVLEPVMDSSTAWWP